MQGRSQWELCAEVGIGPTVLSEIIAGRRPIEPWIQKKIAEVLNADPDWLFFELRDVPNLGKRETTLSTPGANGTTETK